MIVRGSVAGTADNLSERVNNLRSPEAEAFGNSDIESPIQEVNDSESPSPLKNEDDGRQIGSSSKSNKVEEDTVLIADNTHEIVIEKLE